MTTLSATSLETRASNGYSGLLDRSGRGFLAGAAGGVVGAGMKLVGEAIYPPRVPGEPVPPAVMVSRVVAYLSGSPLLPSRELLATQVFHWTFSIAAAALYGILAERYPRVTFARGVGFGLVLCVATHETVLPALGLSLPWSQIPWSEHLSEWMTHALFGFSVELVRRQTRRWLGAAHSGN